MTSFVAFQSETMRPDIDYIKEKYRHFNDLCFEGRLPEVPVELCDAAGFLGKACYSAVEDRYGLVIGYSKLKLRINIRYDLPESEVEDVILHEMIHLYIAYHNIPDSSPHGPVFRSLMKMINERYSRHIFISRKGAPEAEDKSGGRVVIVTTFADSSHGITICSPGKLRQIKSSLPRLYRFKSMKCYFSTDPYFRRYPRSVKGIIWKISEEALSLHLLEAKELE